MSEAVNLRVSRSGLSIKSSPIRNMAPSKDKHHTPPKADTTTEGNTALCSMQDIWGFLSSMHTTMMKQSEEIKNLALKNQELEHKLQMQDLRIQHQEEQIQELRGALDKQAATVQDTLATHDEKIAQIHVPGNVGSWASIVKNGHTNSAITNTNDDMYAIEDEKEYHELEKRKMNIVVRGITEKDTEQVLTLNTAITDIISTKFGMHDVVVYGAHRVGKKKPETNRAIVCTLLDARKRAIILENARMYLKDSPLYISEDRTPNQQKARREAYEARTNKKTPITEGGEQEK